MDNGVEREINIPKGDVLHQFRADVANGSVAPGILAGSSCQGFPVRPGGPWYAVYGICRK